MNPTSFNMKDGDLVWHIQERIVSAFHLIRASLLLQGIDQLLQFQRDSRLSDKPRARSEVISNSIQVALPSHDVLASDIFDDNLNNNWEVKSFVWNFTE